MNTKMINNFVHIDEGSGGAKSDDLVAFIKKKLVQGGVWKLTGDDAAVLYAPPKGKKLFYTTDSYIVDPIFFPGGDIGKLAVCGTINDLAVMGAKPKGLSLGLILEEGFPKSDLALILKSIARISKKNKIPVVTGDTKVMPKGSIDKIIINTSGVGFGQKVIKNSGLMVGDKIIVSDSVGEHEAALLASRFDYETSLQSDCRPVFEIVNKVQGYLSACKDPTRGGLNSVLNEMADKSKVKIVIDDQELPVRKSVSSISDILGISVYDLAAEGIFVAGISPKDERKVLNILKNFSKKAGVIGTVEKGRGVEIKTSFGSRVLRKNQGQLVPRIC